MLGEGGNISSKGEERLKNTRFRDFSRVGRTKKRRRRRRRRFLQVGKKPLRLRARSWSIRGREWGVEKAETKEARRETIRDFGGLVLAARIYRRRPFTPSGRTRRSTTSQVVATAAWVARGGRRRMGGRKLLFHLRLRQLGKTAALPCLLPNYERERE